MARKEEKAIERVQPGGALQAPDFMAGDAAIGTEGIGQHDVVMARLALAQVTSPQVLPGKPERIQGLEVGMLFNNLTGQIVPTPVDFVVLLALGARGVQFRPLAEGGGIVDPNVPLDDPRMEFVGDKPPVATKFYDFVVMLLPAREVIALSFKGTGLKVARQLNGLIKVRQKPVWAGRYTLDTQMRTNSKGTFAICSVRNSDAQDEDCSNPGWVSQELYALCGGIHKTLAEKDIKVSREGEENEAGADVDDPYPNPSSREM